MFVQVIQGKVSDAGKVDAAIDLWLKELAPDSIGWMGTTSGVTDDGNFFALAQFSSAEDAQRNSDRPEQQQWWTESCAPAFSGEVTFKNSIAVDVDTQGDLDKAGFVQIIQERVTDADRVRQLMRPAVEQWPNLRPDLLGTILVVHDEGELTTAAYFTSEKEAREGEQTEMPADLQEQMKEMEELSVGEPTYLDLKHPRLASPQTARPLQSH